MRLILLLFSLISITEVAYPKQDQDKVVSFEQELEPAPEPLDFNEEKMESFKNNPEFDYSEKPADDNWWSRLKRYLNLQYQRLITWLFGDYKASDFMIFIFELLPYIIIATVLFLAVWLFNKMNPGTVLLNDAKEGQVFLSEDEEIIKSSNIKELIEEAVAQEDYRLAIRYHFLLVLRELEQNNLINYKFSKTDQDYLAEIKYQPLQQQFKLLTRIYDFFWYGKFDATQEHFQKSRKEFQKMQNIIPDSHD